MCTEKEKIEQKLARTQDKIQRLKEKKRKLENGQKIIIGGMMLKLARKNTASAKALLKLIDENVKKDYDRKRLADVIDELKELGVQDSYTNSGDIEIPTPPSDDDDDYNHSY